MSEEQEKITKLCTMLGMALGALEIIEGSPHNFNSDGLKLVIKNIRDGFDEVFCE